MRIAFVVNRFPKLSETFIIHQITGLMDRGHEVDIFASRPSNDAKVHADVEQYKLHQRTYYYDAHHTIPASKPRRIVDAARIVVDAAVRYPQALLNAANVLEHGKEAFSLRQLYRIKPFLCRHPYDVVHCHFGVQGLFGMYLRRIGALQGKLITTFYGHDLTEYVQQHGPNVYHALFQTGDLFIHISQYQKAKLLSIGCDEQRMQLLRIGVDVNRFEFAPRVLRANEPVRLLTVARLVEKKGLEYGIRAVASLVPRYPNIQYRIVGDGKLRGPLQKLIDTLGVAQQIELVGWKAQEEVRALFAESHLFVLASVTSEKGDEEGQGLVLQEAQAIGLPVVCTRHNGFPEGVVEGKSALLVPERDVHALAAAIEQLVNAPERWSEMGRVGRSHVEQHFDNAKLDDQLVSIYERIAGHSPAATSSMMTSRI